jgi:hypothetical protein
MNTQPEKEYPSSKDKLIQAQKGERGRAFEWCHSGCGGFLGIGEPDHGPDFYRCRRCHQQGYINFCFDVDGDPHVTIDMAEFGLDFSFLVVELLAEPPTTLRELVVNERFGIYYHRFHHNGCGGRCVLKAVKNQQLFYRCNRCHRRGLVPVWTAEGQLYPHVVVDLADWGIDFGIKLVDLLPEEPEAAP